MTSRTTLQTAMAKKKSSRATTRSAKRAARRPVKAGRKRPAAKQAKRPAKRAASKSAAKPASRQRHTFTQGLYGWITHTELASSDPAATKVWCESVLGWTFKPGFPTPDGEYHLFTYSEKGGGGIRRNNPPEVPGSIPYIHVADAQEAYDRAVAAGAAEMLPPTRVMEGVTVAIVRAPGGVAIGLSGP